MHLDPTVARDSEAVAIHTQEEISKLIEPGRVHRRVYTDPEIFELEMERVFGRAWLFVGHSSQVPNPGDYFTTELARQPVVMTRHRDGKVHVLFNRCTHRGAKVVNERCGHAARMTCLYHGWSFDTDGALTVVPIPDGCAGGFRKEDFGLAPVPRVQEYRGFVFASLTRDGSSFEDQIGPMKGNIDDLVDRAPDGELAFDLGQHRLQRLRRVAETHRVRGARACRGLGELRFFDRENGRRGAVVNMDAHRPRLPPPGRGGNR